MNQTLFPQYYLLLVLIQALVFLTKWQNLNIIIKFTASFSLFTLAISNRWNLCSNASYLWNNGADSSFFTRLSWFSSDISCPNSVELNPIPVTETSCCCLFFKQSCTYEIKSHFDKPNICWKYSSVESFLLYLEFLSYLLWSSIE